MNHSNVFLLIVHKDRRVRFLNLNTEASQAIGTDDVRVMIEGQNLAISG